MSPEQQASREKFGCPRCLPITARIDTPGGAIPVGKLVRGSVVFTRDARGRRVARPLVAVSRTPVGEHHVLTRVLLDDGRVVSASPEHPTATGKPVGALVVDAQLDGARVVRVERIEYHETHTVDILPAGPTGVYWADGVLVGSTLQRMGVGNRAPTQ
jgi:hypothetical protein